MPVNIPLPRTALRAAPGPVAVAALLFAGFFKPLPMIRALPIDLTVAAACLVVLLIALQLSRDAGASSVPLTVIPVLVVAAAGFWPAAGGPYAIDARQGLALVALSAAGAYILVNTEDRQRAWVWAHVGMGCLYVLLTSAFTINQLAHFGNTIAAGQAAGVAAVVLVVLAMSGAIGSWQARLIAGATVVVLAASMIATGSRGPVLAAGLAVLVVAVLAPQPGRVLRIAASLAVIYAAAEFLNRATGEGASRLQLALSGRFDNVASRRPIWDSAIEYAVDHPIGVGWGNSYQTLGRTTGGSVREYPHNVVLEAAVEGGWLTAVLLVAFMVAGLNHLRRAAHDPYSAALLGIAVFFVAVSMVSGSIADNRMMFAAVTLGFVVNRPRSQLSHLHRATRSHE